MECRREVSRILEGDVTGLWKAGRYLTVRRFYIFGGSTPSGGPLCSGILRAARADRKDYHLFTGTMEGRTGDDLRGR